MDLLNPWNQIEITAVRKNDSLQFFDDKIRIIYVLVGSVCIKFGDLKTVLGNGDFFILTKAQSYDISKTHGKVYCFTLEVLRDNVSVQKYVFQGDSVNKVRRADFEVRKSLEKLLLLRVSVLNESWSQLYKEYFTLLYTLEKYYAKELVFQDSTQGKHRIQEIKQYIDIYFDRDLTLSNLAQKIFVSEQYLSKLFKEEIGIGVSEYIIRRRLEKVRRFLTETELPITDIAFESGFTNINSFNRLFKKYQGVTPSVYRAETKKQVVITSNPNELEEVDFSGVKDYIEKHIQESEHQVVSVSLDKGHSFSKDKLLINLGFAEDLLHRSYIKAVKPVSQYADFQYGRIWGIISQSILPEIDGCFDFTKVNEILQAVLDLGLKPFLDLGLKGKVVHGANRQIISQTLVTLPNQNFKELLKRYQALMQHCIERFGYEEVSGWKVELWKPNTIVLNSLGSLSLAQFEYQGGVLDLTTNAGYLTYFNEVYKALKKLLPDVLIGGCGISASLEGKDSERLLQDWVKEPVQPDFISMHIFPMDMVKQRKLQNSDFYISPDSDYLVRAIKEMTAYLTKLKFSCNLYVTEFNVTINSRDIINDTCFKGPYILKNTLPILEDVAMLGYWQLSDFSSKSPDVAGQEIFGGSGLITKNGIPKPAFYAFDFIGNLGNDLLYFSDGLMVTKKGQNIIIVAYHYCHLNSSYYYGDEKLFDKNNVLEMFEQDGVNKFGIILSGLLSDRTYQIKKRKMGIDSGAILAEVNQFSSLTRYKEDEIDYLKHRCLPILSKEYIASQGDSLSFEMELSPHDMLLVEISPC